MLLDLIYFPIIIMLGLGFIQIFRTDLKENDLVTLRQLFFFHLLIGAYYCFFIQGDAIGYWRIPKTYSFALFQQNIFNGEGTAFMHALNYFPTNILNMSYFSNTMLYSLLGFMGIAFFYMVAKKTVPYNKIVNGYVLFPLIFFLPQMHFWSSGIGKDTILFLCIGMFVYGLLSPVKRVPLIIVAMLLSLAIRPHIALFLLVSFGLAYILGGKVSGLQRFLLSAVLLGIGIAILPSVMEFAKIEEASVESFEEFAAGKADVLSRSHTGSAIDISSYPLPLKILTFLFRPFFFDVRNIQGLVASLENFVLVYLFVMTLKRKPVQAFNAAPFVIKGMVFFLIIGTLAFSQSMGNVGIMIRMRNMFLPGLLIYMMWTFSYEQQATAALMKLKKKKQLDKSLD